MITLNLTKDEITITKKLLEKAEERLKKEEVWSLPDIFMHDAYITFKDVTTDGMKTGDTKGFCLTKYAIASVGVLAEEEKGKGGEVGYIAGCIYNKCEESDSPEWLQSVKEFYEAHKDENGELEDEFIVDILKAQGNNRVVFSAEEFVALLGSLESTVSDINTKGHFCSWNKNAEGQIRFLLNLDEVLHSWMYCGQPQYKVTENGIDTKVNTL